jgi:O-antigen ligase
VREYLVALSGGLTLAFAAWGLGGIPAWSLQVLLSGGLLTLLLSLLDFSASHRGLPVRIAGKSVRRLLTWPFFWLSLLFLLYLMLGALNPSAAVLRDERGWWVEAVAAPWATWLPSSVVADYQPMNAWRAWQMHLAACSLAWGLWAGLTRRKVVLFALWALLLSGAGMGLVAILQHLSEAKAVLWNFPSSNRHFWGSFFYRNQAAAYLNLVLVAAAFLFFYHAVKTRQHVRSGGPHFLCFFLFVITATSVALALSRGGILFGSVISIVFIALLLVFVIQGLWHLRSLWLTLCTLLLLAGGTYSVITYVDLDAIDARFGDIEKTIENADQDARAISTRATWDMAQDRLTLGWGAGSFRYIFPMYQRNYPRLFHARYDKRKEQWVGRKVYRYAHNDIVQFVAEYGIVGSALIFGGILSLLLQALYHSHRHAFAVLILLVGAGQAFSHAFLDFIFNSPAYWLALIGFLALATKLLSLENRAQSRISRTPKSPSKIASV